MLGIALQEWAAVCDLLGRGEIVLTVRKGGIHERGGGLFALDHPRFLLMPTYLHQQASRLRAGAAVQADPQPGRHRIALWAEAAAVWRILDRAALAAVAGEQAFAPAELEARFAYRGRPELFAVALRVHRLASPDEIPDDPAYAGCRSWVALRQEVATAGSQPVLGDAAFAERLAGLARALNQP